jgi:hypothetical protein
VTAIDGPPGGARIGTQTDRFKWLMTHASIVTMGSFTGVTDHPGYWYMATSSFSKREKLRREP